MSGSGQKAFPKGCEWSGGNPEGPGVVRISSWRAGGSEKPTQRAGSGQEALPKSWEWSAGPPEGPGVVGRPSWRAWSCKTAF